jgi:tRNA(Ile2) C34 agmatinyltransferase TiaS
MFPVIAGLFVVGCIASEAERARAFFLRKQDDELLEHLLSRTHVICPDCRLMFEVRCLEEQFNTQWRCAACGCQFREYAHHTAKRSEL